jgi:hypothetical protein
MIHMIQNARLSVQSLAYASELNEDISFVYVSVLQPIAIPPRLMQIIITFIQEIVPRSSSKVVSEDNMEISSIILHVSLYYDVHLGC